MHLQLFHANHFFIKSVKKSNRPRGISSITSQKKREKYFNTLIVFTSIEVGDSEQTCLKGKVNILDVFERIRSLNSCNSIVIIPYSHQSNIEVNSSKSYPLIMYLKDLISNEVKDVEVYLGDFGFSNEWEINVKSHKLSCLYRKI